MLLTSTDLNRNTQGIIMRKCIRGCLHTVVVAGCAVMLVLRCSGARGRRGIQAGIAEKKISILERALEFHPGSDRLLMALLDAVSLC